MASTQKPVRLTRELAEFLAQGPSPEQLLKFRPSADAQERASALLAAQRERRLSSEEEWELDEFEHAEMLIQLIKGTIRDLQASSHG